MRSLFKSPFNSPMRSPTAEESYAFKIHLTPGAFPYDEVTNVPASCSISGVRYGLVNGIVSSFASNVPPIEGKGLRGCPAFTQLAKYTEDLTNAAWSKSNILTPTLAGTFQGQNIWNCPESTTASAYHNLSQRVALSALPDNSIVGMAFVAKYSGRKLSISLQTKTNTYVGAVFNLQTGVMNANAGLAASIISLGSGYYYLFFAASLLSGDTNPLLYAQTALEDNSPQYTGDGVSGFLIGQPTYINFGVNGTPFIPPYVPNNTGSSVSVVSEAATATTGTSFDLDASTLSRLKAGLRGSTLGSPEKHNPSTDTAGYFNTNSTNATLEPSTNSRTTGWIPVGNYAVYEVVSSGTRSRVQCKKDDGTILFLKDSAVSPYRLTIPAGYTQFRIYYEADISTNPTAALSAKAVSAHGHIELEVESNVYSGWYTSATAMSGNIFTVNNSDFVGALRFSFQSSACSIRLEDNASNYVSHPAVTSMAVGQTFRISLDYGTYTDGTQKMRLTVNGVKSSVVDFSGSFGSQDLRFFFGNTIHAGWIKSLTYSDRPVW